MLILKGYFLFLVHRNICVANKKLGYKFTIVVVRKICACIVSSIKYNPHKAYCISFSTRLHNSGMRFIHTNSFFASKASCAGEPK
jgi:hypothetical protein